MEKTQASGLRVLRVQENAVVAEAITNTVWSLPHPRSSATWKTLRPRAVIKEWVDVVWFKGGILKHQFTMWIANYDRLPTRSRLAAWGLQISHLCPFCSNHEETRDHMLLSCEYNIEVWKEILHRCRPPSTNVHILGGVTFLDQIIKFEATDVLEEISSTGVGVPSLETKK
ncbi:uncharacterized protein LOC108845283 [Raphanus sativus]|uniref:Uncharacterized protein LOC108845283 n=1 Tax=Raphanus sativus TaxID=3726 RepID=A0A6J0MNH3_RAPSA|nr:uncharacterized protein LOC108845283 [Raphanus sativus]